MADWTPTEDVKLAELWAEGLSCGAIGFRMQRSKNSVVGRVHRTGLPPRPSPIRAPAGIGQRTHRKRAPLPKLQQFALPVELPIIIIAKAPTPIVPPKAAPQAPRVAPVAFAITLGNRASRQFPPERKCQFPIGQPGTKGFRFCGEKVTTPGPYCDEHRKVCYVRPGRSAAEIVDDELPTYRFVEGRRILTDEGRARIAEGVRAAHQRRLAAAAPVAPPPEQSVSIMAAVLPAVVEIRPEALQPAAELLLLAAGISIQA